MTDITYLLIVGKVLDTAVLLGQQLPEVTGNLFSKYSTSMK